jgi:hypothetical protein
MLPRFPGRMRGASARPQLRPPGGFVQPPQSRLPSSVHRQRRKRPLRLLRRSHPRATRPFHLVPNRSPRACVGGRRGLELPALVSRRRAVRHRRARVPMRRKAAMRRRGYLRPRAFRAFRWVRVRRRVPRQALAARSRPSPRRPLR